MMFGHFPPKIVVVNWLESEWLGLHLEDDGVCAQPLHFVEGYKHMCVGKWYHVHQEKNVVK
jgi:hypothetical protein